MIRTEYQLLANAFPSKLKMDLEEVFRILSFERAIKLPNGQLHNLNSLISSDGQIVSLDGELFTIPNRLYFIEPNGKYEEQLTHIQKQILNCIFLRHHDGFVRQKGLEQLINSTDYFITPFTFHLLGDYVLEIIEVLDKHITGQVMVNFVKFINDNKKYLQQTESRMISYWNEYYRLSKYPRLKDYPGMKIFDRIKEAF